MATQAHTPAEGYFVSITRLRLRGWWLLPAFFWYAMGSSRQAKAAKGYVALSLLREEGNVFWTRTVWESADAMRAFMLAGAH